MTGSVNIQGRPREKVQAGPGSTLGRLRARNSWIPGSITQDSYTHLLGGLLALKLGWSLRRAKTNPSKVWAQERDTSYLNQRTIW